MAPTPPDNRSAPPALGVAEAAEPDAPLVGVVVADADAAEEAEAPEADALRQLAVIAWQKSQCHSRRRS